MSIYEVPYMRWALSIWGSANLTRPPFSYMRSSFWSRSRKPTYSISPLPQCLNSHSESLAVIHNCSITATISIHPSYDNFWVNLMCPSLADILRFVWSTVAPLWVFLQSDSRPHWLSPGPEQVLKAMCPQTFVSCNTMQRCNVAQDLLPIWLCIDSPKSPHSTHNMSHMYPL